MAGFNIKRLINEPTSAAFAYGIEKNKTGTFFVYDLEVVPLIYLFLNYQKECLKYLELVVIQFLVVMILICYMQII